MINPTDMSTTMFNLQGRKVEDMNTLTQLNVTNNRDEDLKKAAQNFEAVFVAQFLETMDKTVEKGEFMHGGQGEETFKSMLNQEIALNISSNPRTSFGMAEQIYKQMKDKI